MSTAVVSDEEKEIISMISEKQKYLTANNCIRPQPADPVTEKKEKKKDKKSSEKSVSFEGDSTGSEKNKKAGEKMSTTSSKSKSLHVLIFGACSTKQEGKEKELDVYSPSRLPTEDNVKDFMEKFKEKNAFLHFLDAGQLLAGEEEKIAKLQHSYNNQIKKYNGKDMIEAVVLFKKSIEKDKTDKSFCVINAGYWLDIYRNEVSSFYKFVNEFVKTANNKVGVYPFYLYKSKINLLYVLEYSIADGEKYKQKFDMNTFTFSSKAMNKLNVDENFDYTESILSANPKEIAFNYFLFVEIFLAYHGIRNISQERKESVNSYLGKLLEIFKRSEENAGNFLVKIVENYLRTYISLVGDQIKSLRIPAKTSKDIIYNFAEIGKYIVELFTKEGE